MARYRSTAGLIRLVTSFPTDRSIGDPVAVYRYPDYPQEWYTAVYLHSTLQSVRRGIQFYNIGPLGRARIASTIQHDYIGYDECKLDSCAVVGISFLHQCSGLCREFLGERPSPQRR